MITITVYILAQQIEVSALFWKPFYKYKKWYLVVSRKNIYYLCENGIKKSVPNDHRFLSLGKPRDAKRWSTGRSFFLSQSHIHDGILYSNICSPLNTAKQRIKCQEHKTMPPVSLKSEPRTRLRHCLVSLSKTFYPLLSSGSTQERSQSDMTETLLTGT